MKIYQHILVVVNALTEKEAEFMQQVISEHPEVYVKLSLIHTLPKIPGEYFYLPSIVALKSRLEKEAYAHLDSIGALLNVPSDDRGVVATRGKHEIERIAEAMHVDMIINHRQASAHFSIPSVKIDNSLRRAIGTLATQGGIMAY